MITGKDMTTIMDLLVAAYGEKAYPLNDPQQMNKIVQLWAVMFKDDEPEEVLLAVKNCIATLTFPPRIADIKNRIAQSRMSGQMTEMEAWSEIRKAVNDSGTYADANKAFLKLPVILQKSVGTPSSLKAWRQVSNDTFEGVIASNFMRSYKENAKNEAMYNALPKDMQASQSYLNPTQSEVEMLPEPAPQKSFEERSLEMDIDAQIYRERNGILSKPEYEQRAEDFKQPISEAEQKMFEAKKRREESLRMEWMKERLGKNA